MARALSILVASALVAAACGGGGSDADPEAFCATLDTNSTLVAGRLTIQSGALDELVRLAPDDIRGSVETVRNTTSSLESLGNDDLGELFARAFDPEADEARQDLSNYARTSCDIDVVGGEVEALQAWLDEKFANQRWVGNLALDIDVEDDGLAGVNAEFLQRPIGEDPTTACNALALYLYDERDGTGAVTVTRDGEVLASQEGPDVECQEP